MQKLKEPLVVQLYDSYIVENNVGPDRYSVFELEKCSCSLDEYLERQNKDGQLNEDNKFQIAIQIIDSVNYIHSFNIIHRDIKPENFLVYLDEKQPEIKLQIYKFINLLVLSDSAQRASLYDIVEQSDIKFFSNSKEMKQIVQKTLLIQNDKKIEQNATIEINSLEDLSKIQNYNIVTMHLKQFKQKQYQISPDCFKNMLFMRDSERDKQF
ncbi:kinase domain protein (macronuclear) [Tetrahymena thermophila SB210]|uniref:Kinase domain protein n=1 Tax=Tetrahymena thermophila (strain SB210) TaxID=312017 RepID=Q239N9_TETTS|nr:kinase domain protein [Tetrahymena thermophila SB210]EAR93231.1 kinase domain protein [Tetrahymena thermophila SB210]|eukprot:XP_001013476.1 kinase domain protein [Tetrahymena thermophila SB210]